MIEVKRLVISGLVLDLNKFILQSEVEQWAKTVKRPSSLAYSTDGNTLLIGTIGGNVVRYDLSSKQQSGAFVGHKDVVSSVAVSKDGNWVLTASYDKTVRLWKQESQVLVHCLEGHEEAVFGASFLGTADFAVSVSGDKRLNVWDLSSGKLIATKMTEFPLYCCAISPDGKTILAGTAGKSGRLLWFQVQV